MSTARSAVPQHLVFKFLPPALRVSRTPWTSASESTQNLSIPSAVHPSEYKCIYFPCIKKNYVQLRAVCHLTWSFAGFISTFRFRYFVFSLIQNHRLTTCKLTEAEITWWGCSSTFTGKGFQKSFWHNDFPKENKDCLLWSMNNLYSENIVQFL